MTLSFSMDRTPRPPLPTKRAEMIARGWDSIDVLLVSGDAYVDHPSFANGLIARLLEAAGFRVAVLAQPDWSTCEPWRQFGRPRLFFGISAGNMDSMINHYTANRKVRNDDAYSPDGVIGRRPDRATLAYCQRSREAFPGVPVVAGGVEASLRRIAHYDYWSDTVRRSILLDSKADLVVFGMGERTVLDVARGLAAGKTVKLLRDLRGVAYRLGASEPPPSDANTLELPDYDSVVADKLAFCEMTRISHLETNPHNARRLVQRYGRESLVVNPPALPLEQDEMDEVYGLPFTRRPHPSYGRARIPAYEVVENSVQIMRGCFGGCTFCSITEHEGRIIQSRSEESILREIEEIRDKTPGFTGVISDVGGPTANMYRMACKDPKIETACRRLSCVFPDVCENLGTDHTPLINLYRKARELPGIKKVFVASGLRYDLAVRSPEYVKELATHHVGGYLKIAPEHIEEGPLSKMMKPGIGSYDKFKEMFDRFSKEAGKEQYLIPYFIAAHPGTTDEDMLALAIWLKHNGFRLDQVQTFLPTPLALATAMYHTNKNPLRKVTDASEEVKIIRGGRQRRLHKAFLRYHDPENWPMLREALNRMGRADLIGNGKRHLVPAFQPAGTGTGYRTQHVRKVVPPLARPAVYRKLAGKAKRVR